MQSFACYPESPTHVTYRARLGGTSETDSGSLISLLEEWVNGRASVIVTGVLMTMDSECSVAISSLSEEECSTMQTPTTDPTTSGNMTTTGSTTNSGTAPSSETTASTSSQSSHCSHYWWSSGYCSHHCYNSYSNYYSHPEESFWRHVHQKDKRVSFVFIEHNYICDHKITYEQIPHYGITNQGTKIIQSDSFPTGMN